jgi:hypothetical protein
MQQSNFFNRTFTGSSVDLPFKSTSRKAILGIILVIALVAFEVFNFDTTRFALNDVLGDVSFFGITWATILAIAFCAIDFAGLARLFTPERGAEEPKAVWFLMGAWLLGATMNAIMTWWAVSLNLLSHDFGNEVLGRQQLLTIVPVFVAGLVLLTRILFIGAFSVAGEHIFDLAGNSQSTALPAQPQPVRQKPLTQSLPTGPTRVPPLMPVEDDRPQPLPAKPSTASRPVPGGRPHPRPTMPTGSRPMPAPMSAKPRR